MTEETRVTYSDVDPQYHYRRVLGVQDDDVYWNVESSDDPGGTSGWYIAVEKVEGVPEPKAGRLARFYGKGLGYPVRGFEFLSFPEGTDVNQLMVDLNLLHEQNMRDDEQELLTNSGARCYVYSYESEEDYAASWERMREEENAKKERAFDETGRAKQDAQFDGLPEEFQQRIVRFRRHCPKGEKHFRINFEPYELFVCEEAVKILKALEDGTIQAIEDTDLRGILSDDHSGNTAGACKMLARAALENPEYVVWAHGAMTPLTGCEEYGCVTPNDTDWRPEMTDSTGFLRWGTTTQAPLDEETRARFENIDPDTIN